eukprot:31121-Chlamydomonas_euryale.AAC.8
MPRQRGCATAPAAWRRNCPGSLEAQLPRQPGGATAQAAWRRSGPGSLEAQPPRQPGGINPGGLKAQTSRKPYGPWWLWCNGVPGCAFQYENGVGKKRSSAATSLCAGRVAHVLPVPSHACRQVHSRLRWCRTHRQASAGRTGRAGQGVQAGHCMAHRQGTQAGQRGEGERGNRPHVG